MSKAHYIVHEKNLIQMISGGNFYGEDDAFLRELLQNAYDACYTKKELQVSWGAELLALTTEKADEFAKLSYQPRITMKYQSELQLFTVEDNGIGMDITDFDKYFRQIGASYYVGDEYEEQQLTYVPIGHFGLGMLSCFGVANSISLESRKDKAINTAWNKGHFSKLIPIHVHWSKWEDMIHIEPGKKMNSGTIVGLKVNKLMAERMSLEYLQERIEHYMAFQRIPIEIKVDEESKYVNLPKMKREDHLRNVKGIHVIDLEDELMEGYLTIFQEQHREMIANSILYQQGFLVTSDVEQLGLQPEWLRCMRFRINIKIRYLNLRCNRDGVVKDKKLESIRIRIGLKIMRYFQTDKSRIVPYLKSGRNSFFSSYKSELIFLAEAVRILIYRNGQKVNASLAEILEACAGHRMKVAAISEGLYDAYSKKYPSLAKERSQNYDLLLFEQNMHIFLQLLDECIRKKEYKIGNESGMVYLELEIDMPFEWQTIRNIANYHWSNYTLGQEYQSIICYTCNDHDGLLDLTMNPAHPFIQTMNRSVVTPRMQQTWAVIVENIKQRILSKSNRFGRIIDFNGSFVDFWSDERVITMESAGCLEKNFPEMMNAYIREQVPDSELRKMGLQNICFRKSDFIPWWFEDYWDVE